MYEHQNYIFGFQNHMIITLELLTSKQIIIHNKTEFDF